MPVTTSNQCLIACFDGLGSGITPTGPTAVSRFPISNLGNSQLFSRGRTAALTEQTLTWDMGTAREMNVFMLAGTNATLDVQRRFRAADNSGFTTNVVQSGVALADGVDTSLGQSYATHVAPWGRTLVYVLSESITKRYYRWHQSDITNPDGYQEWAIARLGLGIQLPVETWRSQPKVSGVIGSQKLQRGHELTFNLLTRDQAYSLESIANTAVESRRMLVIPEPLRPETFINDALWCTLDGMHSREAIAGTSNSDKRWRVTMTFREAER